MRKTRKDKGARREHYSSEMRLVKKHKKCISLDKSLWAEVDHQARARVQTRSEFINEVLRNVLGSKKSMIEYELKVKSKQLNQAKLDAANLNSEQEIEAAMKEIKK